VISKQSAQRVWVLPLDSFRQFCNSEREVRDRERETVKQISFFFNEVSNQAQVDEVSYNNQNVNKEHN
jgi:hypothetical protein